MWFPPGWATERPWLDDLAAFLRAALGVTAIVSEVDTDPWTVHAPSIVEQRSLAQ
jgi:hypothetical protein